jgi:cell division protein FtsW
MTSILISGALINTSVVLGLLPTTGIPCPFLSYGGSSVVMAMCGVGILLNISQQKALKKRKSYSKPYRWKRK